MPVHIGKKIREEVDRQRISVTAFAKRINRSRNDAYDIFKRESVDTELLYKVGLVLNCDFFSLLSAQKEFSKPDMTAFVVSEDNEGGYMPMSKENLLKMQQENQTLRKEIDHYKKVIALLESKRPGKARKK